MANPYPWYQEKTHKNLIRIYKWSRNGSLFVTIPVAIVFSVLSLFVYFSGRAWARLRNDAPQRVPQFIMALSVIAASIMYGIFSITPIDGIAGLAQSVTDDNDMTFGQALLQYLFIGLPISTFFAAITLLFDNKKLEYTARRYLEDTRDKPNLLRYTLAEKLRIKKNSKKFAESDLDPDNMEIGVVVGDVLPWRRSHIGHIVGSRFSQIMHALFVGGTNSGKTVLAMNYIAECVENGWAIFLPDFKGSRKTEAMLATIAYQNDVPFYSFWSSTRDTGFHYDPLQGPRGLPPVDVFITALGFSTSGDSEHFTSIVNTYLNNQFRALEENLVEIREDESTFDWLWRTSDPEKFVEELKASAGRNDEHIRNTSREISDKVRSIKLNDLAGYRSRLNNIIDTVGHKMRPKETSIDLRHVAREQGVVYFGLPSSGDKMVMRALGALIVRDAVAMMNERESGHDDDDTPVLVIADEAPQLKESAELFLEFFQMGRSANIFAALIVQTIAQFDDKFIREVLGNNPSIFALKTSDIQTVDYFVEHFGEIPVRGERRNTSTDTETFGVETQVSSNTGMGEISEAARITRKEFDDLLPRQFFAYLPNSRVKKGKSTVSQATLKRSPRGNRVKNDEAKKDIPTALAVSRDYLLQGEDDKDIANEMLDSSRKQYLTEASRPTPPIDIDDNGLANVSEDDIAMSEPVNIQSRQEPKEEPPVEDFVDEPIDKKEPVSEPEVDEFEGFEDTDNSVESEDDTLSEWSSENKPESETKDDSFKGHW